MKIAVIDDEKYSRSELIHQIRSVVSDAEIKEASNGVMAADMLGKETFDILFIDVHLGDMEGTTLAALARRLMPQAQIIFATAFSEYAVQAFELGVDNYILKPFDPSRVKEVLMLCQKALTPDKRTEIPEKLAVTSNRHTILISVSDITYIETVGTGRGCVIHLLSGKEYTSTLSLSEYEQKLSNAGFFRTHKTCIVQLCHIRDIFPWANNCFALRAAGSETILPIGREKVKELRRRLDI